MSERATKWGFERKRENRRRKGETTFLRSLALTHGRSLPPAAILCSLVDPAFPAGPRENIGRRFPAIARSLRVIRATEMRRDRRTTNRSRRPTSECVATRTQRSESVVQDTLISRRAGQFVLRRDPFCSPSRPRYSRPRKHESMNRSGASSFEDIVSKCWNMRYLIYKPEFLNLVLFFECPRTFISDRKVLDLYCFSSFFFTYNRLKLNAFKIAKNSLKRILLKEKRKEEIYTVYIIHCIYNT